VIHTAGPVWRGGNNNEPALLKACYINSLALALSKGIKTIAFPNISTGVYGYPKKEAAKIAIRTVQEWFTGHDLPVVVIFAVFDEENHTLYHEMLQNV
jgi:O-acetyl-ADP-ribose deacetylase (regulator of RNase III)